MHLLVRLSESKKSYQRLIAASSGQLEASLTLDTRIAAHSCCHSDSSGCCDGGRKDDCNDESRNCYSVRKSCSSECDCGHKNHGCCHGDNRVSYLDGLGNIVFVQTSDSSDNCGKKKSTCCHNGNDQYYIDSHGHLVYVRKRDSCGCNSIYGDSCWYNSDNPWSFYTRGNCNCREKSSCYNRPTYRWWTDECSGNGWSGRSICSFCRSKLNGASCNDFCYNSPRRCTCGRKSDSCDDPCYDRSSRCSSAPIYYWC